MATRLVFTDDYNNEMNCYINDDGKVYIGITQDDDSPYGGHIVLDKSDVTALIKVLTDLEKDMED